MVNINRGYIVSCDLNPVIRSIKYLEIEKSIVDHLEGNLQKIKQKKLIEQQKAQDDFWAERDAERKKNNK